MKEMTSDVCFLCKALYQGCTELFKVAFSMQREGDINCLPRVLFHSSLMYSCGMGEEQDDYSKVLRLKTINILFNSNSALLSDAAVSRLCWGDSYTFKGEEHLKQLNHQEQRLELIFVQLDKSPERCRMTEELKEWFSFFNIERSAGVSKRNNTLTLPGGRPSFKSEVINQAVDMMARLADEQADAEHK